MPTRRPRMAQDATENTEPPLASTTPAQRKPRKAVTPPAHKPGLTTQQRSMIIGLINDHPTASDGEVAEMAGVSRTTVLRIRDKMDATGTESTDEYGRQLGKRLPMAERVRLWARLARGKADPGSAFVQKAALQRVEELIGHVTAKEKREADANATAPGPIFIFAAQSAPSAAPVLPAVVVQAEDAVLIKQDVDKATT